MALVDRLGAHVTAGVRYLFFLVAFFYLTVKMLLASRSQGGREVLRQVLLQVYFTGVQGVVPVAGLAVVVGALAIAQGVGVVGPLAGGEGVGRLVTLVVLREVAPLLTAGVVIVRSVTAIAAELGVMRVQREIEALEVMGISPILHLVAPRLVGGVAALAALNVVFDAIAVGTGLLIAAWLGAPPPGLLFNALVTVFSPAELGLHLAKIAGGGAVVFLIGCLHGLEVVHSPAEVPVAVSRAALRALVFLVLWHAGFSLGSLALAGGQPGGGL